MGDPGAELKEYVCQQCGYIYNPAMGVKKPHVPPGVPFEALPDDWACPVCGAPKSRFSQVAE